MSDFEKMAEWWLDQHKAGEVYGGELKRDIMDVIRLIDSQGHSGMSASLLFQSLAAINKEYTTYNSAGWQELHRQEAEAPGE